MKNEPGEYHSLVVGVPEVPAAAAAYGEEKYKVPLRSSQNIPRGTYSRQVANKFL